MQKWIAERIKKPVLSKTVAKRQMQLQWLVVRIKPVVVKKAVASLI